MSASGTVRPLLVLWDIDHTLIETGGVGTLLYVAAFEAVTGRRVEHVSEAGGRTETAILAETLERHGIDSSAELVRHYCAELARRYQASTAELLAKGRALPGAAAALAAVAELPGVVPTVLTGNLREVAHIKLRTFGLDELIHWEIGSYGEDATERAALVAVAQERAGAKHDATFHRHNSVIIGDTVQDVRAAMDGGARIVAVASGRDSAAQLRESGAEVVLTDLTDAAQVVAAVTRLRDN